MADNVRLRVRGRQAALSGETRDSEVSAFLNARVKAQVEVPVAARGVPTDVAVAEVAADEGTDVVELEFEGGIRQYINPAQLREDVAKRNPTARGATEDVVEVPTDFGTVRTRGVGDLVLKGLKVFGIDPTGAAATQAVRLVLSTFEDKLEPGPGLYRLHDPSRVDKRITDEKELDTSAPHLLFLHGTASSIAGSFGGLVSMKDGPAAEVTPTADWNELTNRYGTRILALQHKTLSESPVRNALDLIQLLPAGARLHVVSHSRGGLIGELLCLTELQDWHFAAFDRAVKERLRDAAEDAHSRIKEVREIEAENIRRLSEAIRAKRLQVERFVRVACPARGTVLASKRLDLYLSVFLNVISFIPGLDESSIYAFVKATLLETARRRTDPRELPGIEAMMPESPLIHILNQEALRSTADLAVIAGDLEPEGVWKKLATLAVDLFYRQDHDLVVNTRAMYGGMERIRKASYFFNKGPHVNHFHYFRNPGTRSRIRDWLLKNAGDKVEGFSEYDPRQVEFTPDTRRAEEDSRPVLILLPDLLGNGLQAADGLLWLSTPALAKGGLDRLKNEVLEPAGLLPRYYAAIYNELQRDYRIEPFMRDWRKSVLDDRHRFEELVRRELAQGRRVLVLAHGAGGVLGLLLTKTPLWTDVTRGGGRLLLLGGHGAASGLAASLLSTANRLNRMLRMLDQRSETAPEQMFRSFRGVLELIEARLHEKLGLTAEERSFSDKLLSELATDRAPANTAYLAGAAEQTPVDISPEEDLILTTSAGDGHVTWDETRRLGLPTWQMGVPHGNLANSVAGVEVIRELLSHGSTERLKKLALTPSEPDGEISVDDPLLYPSVADLTDAALGGSTEAPIAMPEPPLRAWVSHGHLKHASFPLMVGHYHDDSIVSAEKVLDIQLGGRLTSRFAMGTYAGAADTAEVVLVRGGHPPGALVIGLGEVGELTAEKVRRSATSALLRYVLALTENTAASDEARTNIGFSTLLIGAYGELTIGDSVSALVRAALEVNRQLRLHSSSNPPRIASIEFIDLYEDVAIQAAHELLTLAERMNGDGASGQLVNPQQTVRELEGGQSSRPLNPHQSGWWRRIKVGIDATGGFQFTILTERARADDLVQSTQRQLVQGFVRQAVTSTTYDKELSATLFQLLVPRRLHQFVSDRVNVVIVVDSDSAQYPWELLGQRTRNSVEPLATTCGLLRQLRSSSSEPRLTSASGNAALVIGDTNSGSIPLLSARKEADLVEQKLSTLYDVKRLPPDVSGLRLVSELLSRHYRVVHLAAHGHFDPRDPARSGIRIGEDLWLRPTELRSMQAAPDLVFVNCCYLGGVASHEHQPGPELAAGFAETLMNIGTKAVVVAGWAVEDAAGKTFAERFYDRMLAGERYGDAVLAARQHTRELHPNSNTWGAYQCYGNPDFRLGRTEADQSRLPANKRWYVSRLEILQRLEDIASAAKEFSPQQVREQLDAIREQTPVEWRDGEVLAAFGKAYEALGDDDQAIECYRQALADERSNARISVIQDIANRMERRARSARPETGSKDLEQAIEMLENLSRIVSTGEQASLLGGYYKRQGQRLEGEERTKAFEQALTYYRTAYDKRRSLNHPDLFYPGLNAAALALTLGHSNGSDWRQVIEESLRSAIQKRKMQQDFWSRAAAAEALLLQHLWEDNLAEHEQSVRASYDDVIAGGGQPYEFNSLIMQLRFLAQAVTAGASKTALDALSAYVGSRVPRGG